MLPITQQENGNITVVQLFVNEGFGLEDDAHLEAKKKFAIRVSDQIDYCISFWVKQSHPDESLELSIRGFNCSFEQEKFTKSFLYGYNTKFFISPLERAVGMEGRYYYVRAHLYSCKTQPIDRNAIFLNDYLSTATGRNLIMEEGTSNIFVNVVCRGEVNDVAGRWIKIWNFKVRPLRTLFSTGFVQTTNLLEIWRKNNKKQYTDQQIDNIAENYLLPYNSIPAVINL